MDSTDDNSTNDNSTDTRCRDDFTTSYYIIIASLRALAGLMSFITSIFVMSTIIYLRKYNIFTQRLILYLSVCTLLNGLMVATQGAVYFPANGMTQVYCQISGYLTQVTSWSIMVAIFLVSLNLYFTVATNCQARNETVYLLLIFIMPPLINLLPFIGQSYGHWGPWCWIKSYNDDCSINLIADAFRGILWYLPILFLIGSLVFVYGAIYYTVRKNRRQYTNENDIDNIRMKTMIKDEVKPLLWYPVIFLSLNLFPLINGSDVYGSDKPAIILWSLDACLSPLSGVLTALVYTLDPGTRRRLKKCNVKEDCWNTVKNRSRIRSYPILKAESDSCLKSMNINRDDEEEGIPYNLVTNV